jgi:hypothetical protein
MWCNGSQLWPCRKSGCTAAVRLTAYVGYVHWSVNSHNTVVYSVRAGLCRHVHTPYTNRRGSCSSCIGTYPGQLMQHPQPQPQHSCMCHKSKPYPILSAVRTLSERPRLPCKASKGPQCHPSSVACPWLVPHTMACIRHRTQHCCPLLAPTHVDAVHTRACIREHLLGRAAGSCTPHAVRPQLGARLCMQHATAQRGTQHSAAGLSIEYGIARSNMA